MTTECTTERLEFERFRRQRVVGRFDGGELGSDGGGLLLRELAQRTGLFRRLSACFRDHRDPQRTQHPVKVLVAARVLGLALFADRTSAQTMRANQLRLYFASFAYALLELLRRWGLSGTRLARAQCGTIRLKLLKIGVRIRVSVRAVRLSFDEGFPEAGLFGQVLARLQSLPLRC